MKVITDEEGKINNMFIRLNSSKPLVGAEKRNADPGEIIKLVRSLAGHSFFTDYIRFNTGRMQEHNASVKMFFMEFQGDFADTKKRKLDDFVKDEMVEDVKDAYKKVGEVLEKMTSVFVKKDILLK